MCVKCKWMCKSRKAYDMTVVYMQGILVLYEDEDEDDMAIITSYHIQFQTESYVFMSTLKCRSNCSRKGYLVCFCLFVITSTIRTK